MRDSPARSQDDEQQQLLQYYKQRVGALSPRRAPVGALADLQAHLHSPARAVASCSRLSRRTQPTEGTATTRTRLISCCATDHTVALTPSRSSHTHHAPLTLTPVRADEFETERADLLRRITACSSSASESHSLRCAAQKRSEEVRELQQALSAAHMHLFEERDRLLRLQAENDELRLQADDDVRRIQHLTALTHPVDQEVTLNRGADPSSGLLYQRGGKRRGAPPLCFVRGRRWASLEALTALHRRRHIAGRRVAARAAYGVPAGGERGRAAAQSGEPPGAAGRATAVCGRARRGARTGPQAP